jgi:hypothetical protein
MPYPRALRTALTCAAFAMAAACAESPSAGIPAPREPGTPVQVRLTCSADVRAGTVRCAEPGAAAGPRADRIMGQGSGMKLVSGNISVVADTFAFDVAVASQLSYPVGTTDGVSADPNGIRVFVVDGIHTSQGTGSVTVANADGIGTFTASNQPYFAYPGILQPDSTTAAHRWKFRFDPGVMQFTFGLYLSVPVPPGGGGVWMTVLQPAANAVVPDSVVVRVRIDSASASVASVHASAAGRRVRLLPFSPGVVQGTLSLAGLASGPLQLVVSAGTIRGDTGRVTRSITKDSPPRVTVSAPVNGYVASPDLRIDAECVDDDPAGCASLTAVASGSPARTLATGTSSIHTSVDLSTSHEEQAATVRITGRDSRGTAVEVEVDVFVETGASIARADSAGSFAMDLDATRLLFADSLGVWMRQRTDGTRTQLSDVSDVLGGLDGWYQYSSGWLHAQGAIFTKMEDQAPVYDWRGDTLLVVGFAVSGNIGQIPPAFPLQFAGNWAIWKEPGLIRRDLAAGTNVSLSASTNYENGVAPNGDVVFTGPGREIYRFHNGGATQLTADLDTAHWNLKPVTDGTNVVFFRTDQRGSTTAELGRIALWKGGTITTLSTLTGDYRPHRDYEAAGGWIAYTVVDGGGLKQVRTRAPDGTDRLATSTGSSSTIVALNGDGSLVYGNNLGLYVIRAPYTGPPTRLGANWFRVKFVDAQLLLFLGNSVFQATY